MKQGPIGRMVVLALSVMLIPTACGDDNTADNDTTPTSTAQPTTSTSEATTSTTEATTATTTPSTTTTSTVPEGTETVSVFFSTGDGSDCSQVDEFERQIAVADDAIRGAFDVLVTGPTDGEQAAGASSFFSADTGRTVRSATLQDGLLVVDFEDLRPLMPNASTSCGSEALLAQLNATAFGFSEVVSVRYEISGDCDAFANWLQRECQEFAREA